MVAGASALVAGSAWGRFKGDRPIILGQVSLSFYAVTGAVVHEVLTRPGPSVEVRQGPHEEMFPLLGQGAIDLMAADRGRDRLQSVTRPDERGVVEKTPREAARTWMNANGSRVAGWLKA